MDDEYREAMASLLEGSAGGPVAFGDRIFEALCEGGLDECRIAALLTALAVYPRIAPGAEESLIVSAVRTLRARMHRLDLRGRDAIDTCGTGGDHSCTFNISTAAAFLAAGAGLPVVKHGNRSVSSKSGSADVLEALGVPIEAGTAWAQRCLDDFGFAFCFAPHFHPAMRHVAAVRRKLGFPTVFNGIGPLLNPASASYQLIGIGRRINWTAFAHATALLGIRRAWIVRGRDGLDEITLGDRTDSAEVAPDGTIREFTLSPADFGFGSVDLSELRIGSAAESAAVIERILAGEDIPHARVAIANAAAALAVAGKAENLFNGVELARESIASGRALSVLQRLRNSR